MGPRTTGRPTFRAVVCDDDPLLRRVLATVLAEHGYRVVGESDSVASARDLLEAHTVDVAIVDLALNAGSGEELLKVIATDHPHVTPVVFSAYTEHLDPDAPAAAVFEKPSFDRLGDWLARHAEQSTTAAPERRSTERRRPPLPAPPLPDRGHCSPSGYESWTTFVTAAERLWPGDAVLALDLVGACDIRQTGDEAFLADHRLTLGRLVSPTLRRLDRIAVAPSGVVACLLVATHPEAPAAVFDRLAVAWDAAGYPDTPTGAFCHVRSADSPTVSLARALARLGDPDVSARRPLRLA